MCWILIYFPSQRRFCNVHFSLLVWIVYTDPYLNYFTRNDPILIQNNPYYSVKFVGSWSEGGRRGGRVIAGVMLFSLSTLQVKFQYLDIVDSLVIASYFSIIRLCGWSNNTMSMASTSKEVVSSIINTTWIHPLFDTLICTLLRALLLKWKNSCDNFLLLWTIFESMLLFSPTRLKLSPR